MSLGFGFEGFQAGGLQGLCLGLGVWVHIGFWVSCQTARVLGLSDFGVVGSLEEGSSYCSRV